MIPAAMKPSSRGGQNVGRDPEAPLEFSESRHPREECVANDQNAPALADHLQ
jgi:hypothetical protein